MDGNKGLVQAIAENSLYMRELKRLEEEYNLKVKDIKAKILDNSKMIESCKMGLDIEKIAIAESILEIRGTYAKAGSDKQSVINDAVTWFVHGRVLYNDSDRTNYYANLFSSYFGTKSYDRWYGQRTDCEYGMGPSHGSIIFSVGLKREFRGHDVDPRAVFSNEEREAIVYYLLKLENIQEMKTKAKICLTPNHF